MPSDDLDLATSLISFADLLQDLIDDLFQTGQNRRAIQCMQAQTTLRGAADVILAADLRRELESQSAVDALNQLSAATATLNANAERIAQQQKNVSAAIGIAAGALHIADALAPFNLAAVLQGALDIRGIAQQTG